MAEQGRDMKDNSNPKYPTVSVVIPTYNREDCVHVAIESVLNQTHPPEEIIVADDGSTDDTVAIARRYDTVRVLELQHTSSAAARNRGIEAAKGELVAFLDSDDLWLPDKLELQLRVLRAAPEVGFVITDTTSFGFSVDNLFDMSPHVREYFDKQIGEAGYVLNGEARTGLLRGSFVSTSAVLVRRSLLEQDRFDEALGGWEDFDLWLRLAQRTPFGVIDRVLVRQRQHPGNKSRQALKVADIATEFIRRARTGRIPISSGSLRRRVTAQWARKAMLGYLQAGKPVRAARAFVQSLSHPDPAATWRVLKTWLKTNRTLRAVAEKAGLARKRDQEAKHS